MVDGERVERLLGRVVEDVRELARFRDRGRDLLSDRTQLAAAKYHFITAIEGCARVAHHIIASERWQVADSNAEAIRRLGAEGGVADDTARAVATAVGFRNVLVHQYVDIDDERVVDNLGRLDDLLAFVSDVAQWLSTHEGDDES